MAPTGIDVTCGGIRGFDCATTNGVRVSDAIDVGVPTTVAVALGLGVGEGPTVGNDVTLGVGTGTSADAITS
jgi:hypothetical protein